jgi:hypothetical protein
VPVSGARASLVAMPDLFSSGAFYESARDCALSALEAHHASKNRRVALDAGTALEHLAKAYLATQLEILHYADRARLIPVGPPQVIP